MWRDPLASSAGDWCVATSSVQTRPKVPALTLKRSRPYLPGDPGLLLGWPSPPSHAPAVTCTRTASALITSYSLAGKAIQLIADWQAKRRRVLASRGETGDVSNVSSLISSVRRSGAFSSKRCKHLIQSQKIRSPHWLEDSEVERRSANIVEFSTCLYLSIFVYMSIFEQWFYLCWGFIYYMESTFGEQILPFCYIYHFLLLLPLNYCALLEFPKGKLNIKIIIVERHLTSPLMFLILIF